VLAVLGGLGLSTGVLRFLPEYEVRRDWPGARGFVIGGRWLTLLSTAAAAALYVACSMALSPTGARASVGLIVLVPAMALTTFHAEALRAQRRIELAYLPTLIAQQILVLLIACALVSSSGRFGGAQAILVQGVAAAVVALGQIPLLWSALPRHVVSSVPRYEPSRWLKVSLPLFLVATFILLLSQTDIIMLGLLRGSTDAGMYSAASRTAMLVGLALVAGNATVAPMIAGFFAARNTRGLAETVTTGTRISFLGAVAGVLAATGREVLAWFGPEYVEGYRPLLILAAGQVVSAGAGPVGYLMSLTGHERTAAWVYGVCALVNVAGDAILIPRWGAAGAASATAATMVVWNVWLHFLVHRRVAIRGFLTWRPEPA
jgi:O-antigen/teichoic acid export membrane protein